MPTEQELKDTSTVPPDSSPSSIPEQPYSIFDKRQKALIVGIVSTAATCESLSTKNGLSLLD